MVLAPGGTMDRMPVRVGLISREGGLLSPCSWTCGCEIYTLELLDELCAALQYDLGMALTGAKTDSPDYGSERVLTLFRSCSPQVKPIALSVLEQLTKLK